MGLDFPFSLMWRERWKRKEEGRRKEKEKKENSSYKQKNIMGDRISGLLYQSVAKEEQIKNQKDKREKKKKKKKKEETHQA